MQQRDWANVEELLNYLNENFPFHDDWPDPGPISVHSATGDGDTPLHFVSMWGDLRAVQLLLAAGAEADCPGDMGTSPLSTAVTCGHVAIAKALLAADADPHRKSEFNVSPYEEARRSGNSQVAELLELHAGRRTEDAA